MYISFANTIAGKAQNSIVQSMRLMKDTCSPGILIHKARQSSGLPALLILTFSVWGTPAFFPSEAEAVAVNSDRESLPSQPWKSDPDSRNLDKNWLELRARQLRLLPVPKQIAFEVSPVVLSGKDAQEIVIVVDRNTDQSDVAVNEILSRMEDFSEHLRKKFVVSNTRQPNAYNIVIENHWPNTFTMDQSADPEAAKTGQSYGLYPQPDGIVLSGYGEMGMMYAAVTLRYLMAEKDGRILLYPAKVQDWPDYKQRQLGQFLSPYHLRFKSSLSPDKHLEQMKKYVNWMFRMKGNAVFHHTTASKIFSSKPETLPVSANEMAMASLVSEYARARGIRTMHHAKVRLGEVGKDDNRPGFSKMMLARGGKDYHSWARHDLHRNKAINISEFLLRSGSDMAFVHAVDGGGIADPETWSKRDSLTRELYGNDRAQADADMFGIYEREFNKRGRELVLVAYPYSAGNLDTDRVMKSLRLKNNASGRKKADKAIDELTGWMTEINKKIDRSVRMCVREDNKERLRKYFNIYHGRPMWIYWETAHYTKSIRPLMASTVRSLGSGYFKDRLEEDMVWVNTLDYQWFDEQIQETAAEYSWNTKFPGWSDYDPAYRVSGGVEVDDQEALDILAERAAVGLWGDEAGQYMKEVFNGHMSWKVAVAPYEATKKLNRQIIPDLIERNQKAVNRAIQSMDDLWNHYTEQKALGHKVFDDFSYPYFIQYWGMTKAAKAYADMNKFKIEIQELARAGRSGDAKTLRQLALRQADINEAGYKSTIKLVDGEPWVYREDTGRRKYPQWQLMKPDFRLIRQELRNVSING